MPFSRAILSFLQWTWTPPSTISVWTRMRTLSQLKNSWMNMAVRVSECGMDIRIDLWNTCVFVAGFVVGIAHRIFDAGSTEWMKIKHGLHRLIPHTYTHSGTHSLHGYSYLILFFERNSGHRQRCSNKFHQHLVPIVTVAVYNFLFVLKYSSLLWQNATIYLTSFLFHFIPCM